MNYKIRSILEGEVSLLPDFLYMGPLDLKMLGRNEFALREFSASLRIYVPYGTARSINMNVVSMKRGL